MERTIKIMLPALPLSGTIYFKGFISISEQEDTIIYITEYSLSSKMLTAAEINLDNVIFGYCSNNYEVAKKCKNSLQKSSNVLVLDNSKSIKIKSLVIHGESLKNIENSIIMLYDHKKLKKSETISNSSDYFWKLQVLLKQDCFEINQKYEPIFRTPYWLASSMFAQHFLNYFNLIVWLIRTLRGEKRVSTKLVNLILAILTDIALGYFILEFVTNDEKELSVMLMGILEKLVNALYSLLKWLMGAPAGLKLNNAFNKMLGKYFSYHIQLWWLFLDVSGEKLDTILHVYHYLGYLGVTFQAAIISDMICIATFHSYCIYVYAARLFNIQISGLIALLRLFVGRKYNPLRGGIDSCEYTNQELFVGTVAFTILLLLLPTTTMYYIVFTLFRVLSLGVQYTLAKLIYLVHTLPLYVTALWLANSPKVAGNILIQIENSEEGGPLILRAKLFSKPLQDLINIFKPPVEAPKNFEWTNVLSNILVDLSNLHEWVFKDKMTHTLLTYTFGTKYKYYAIACNPKKHF